MNVISNQIVIPGVRLKKKTYANRVKTYRIRENKVFLLFHFLSFRYVNKNTEIELLRNRSTRSTIFDMLIFF